MSERQTQKLTAPSGKEFEVKTYMTARERNELRNVLLQSFTANPNTGETKVGEINGELLEKSERKSIELALISYDGATENILDRILDGSPEDYDFIVAEANKLANFKSPK
jgi:hypothetical protein